MDKKYNGWTNFATWKVNLEIFDGLTISHFYGDGGIKNIDDSNIIGTLAATLEDYVDEVLHQDQKGLDNECFALTYARAFMDDVNWNEIASHMVENEMEEA